MSTYLWNNTRKPRTPRVPVKAPWWWAERRPYTVCRGYVAGRWCDLRMVPMIPLAIAQKRLTTGRPKECQTPVVG